jgi:hypothetical protein
MQGIFIGFDRPTSKKNVKETLANPKTAHRVRLEATSFFGDEYDGAVADAPNGTYYFVGPDPHTKRKFYGQIIVRNGEVKVK